MFSTKWNDANSSDICYSASSKVWVAMVCVCVGGGGDGEEGGGQG